MPERIDIYIGSRIRKRRRQLALSQTLLARPVGVKFQQIQNYESGRNGVPPVKLHKLARALDVPVQYFFDGFDSEDVQENTTTEEVQEIYLRKESLDLLRTYYKLDTHGRGELLRLAVTLLNQQAES